MNAPEIDVQWATRPSEDRYRRLLHLLFGPGEQSLDMDRAVE